MCNKHLLRIKHNAHSCQLLTELLEKSLSLMDTKDSRSSQAGLLHCTVDCTPMTAPVLQVPHMSSTNNQPFTSHNTHACCDGTSYVSKPKE